MQRSLLHVIAIGTILFAGSWVNTARGAEEVAWSYAGATGPGQWGGLDSSFATCSAGAQQSPLDLSGAIPARDGELEVSWQVGGAEVVDNGHTIQVNTNPGSSIRLEGRDFNLLQFHFHLPSEHTVDGDSIPMEVHFVHQATEGDLAVIGVFMESGAGHPAIDLIWNAIPDAVGEQSDISEFDPAMLLPGGLSYSRYAGSLTTPPCSEVVSWVVLDETITVSQAQVDAFAELYPMNARPVQDRNRRFVLSRP